MAGDERRGGLDWPIAVGGVDVGVTQAGGFDLDEDFTRAGDRLGYVTDGEWLGEIVYHCFSRAAPRRLQNDGEFAASGLHSRRSVTRAVDTTSQPRRLIRETTDTRKAHHQRG